MTHCCTKRLQLHCTSMGTNHTLTSRISACRFAGARWQGHLEVGVLVLQDLLCEVDCSKASGLRADQRPTVCQTAGQFHGFVMDA